MTSRSRARERREQEKQRRRLYWILGIGAVAVVVALIIILPGLGSTTDVVAPDRFDWPESDGTAMGDPEAPVTIVEYSDFQCPFCGRFHQETLPLIVDEYVRSGQVRFEYRNFAFIGRESLEAANASLCAAEQGMFWEYADFLFANQTGENVGAFTEGRLQQLAQGAGLSMDEFERCSSRNEMQDVVQNQYAEALELGVTSTPTFFVNGTEMRGALPFSEFQTAIEAALGG
jgi:protein-disulfide isomerase